MKRCATVPPERWIDWWRGELSGAELDALEEHLLCCDLCALEVTRLAALAEGLGALGDMGTLPPVITPDVLERLEATASVATYRARSGDEIRALIKPEDEFVVLRLEAELTRVVRIDVELRGSNDEVYFEMHDVPFTPAEVIIACHRHVALTTPEVRVRLLGDDGGGRREVARVTLFNRTP